MGWRTARSRNTILEFVLTSQKDYFGSWGKIDYNGIHLTSEINKHEDDHKKPHRGAAWIKRYTKIGVLMKQFEMFVEDKNGINLILSTVLKSSSKDRLMYFWKLKVLCLEKWAWNHNLQQLVSKHVLPSAVSWRISLPLWIHGVRWNSQLCLLNRRIA